MATTIPTTTAPVRPGIGNMTIATTIMVALLVIAPFVGIYPVFVMKALCFALFACAFNLLIGFGGLLSFGHAMFLGTAGYVSAHAAKVWGFSPELAQMYQGLYQGIASKRLAFEHPESVVRGRDTLEQTLQAMLAKL